MNPKKVREILGKPDFIHKPNSKVKELAHGGIDRYKGSEICLSLTYTEASRLLYIISFEKT